MGVLNHFRRVYMGVKASSTGSIMKDSMTPLGSVFISAVLAAVYFNDPESLSDILKIIMVAAPSMGLLALAFSILKFWVFGAEIENKIKNDTHLDYINE